jgi:hypothetical protein
LERNFWILKIEESGFRPGRDAARQRGFTALARSRQQSDGGPPDGLLEMPFQRCAGLPAHV